MTVAGAMRNDGEHGLEIGRVNFIAVGDGRGVDLEVDDLSGDGV